MAPAALLPPPMAAASLMDAMSDAVDSVNVLKAQAKKDVTTFRQYEAACDRVRAFYREQHARQTVAFNVAARARFHSPSRPRPELTVWDALERLDRLVDQSDPDTQLGQLAHLLQTAEALRRDGKPRWMQLTGLLHDLGKLMLVLDDGLADAGDGPSAGQWAVVGDTFVVGCAFDRRCIYADFFAANPDAHDPVYASRSGMYAPNCGLANVLLSWGHDEYLYHVLKDQSTLPPEALAIVRFHSFYPWHKEGAYRHLMGPGDEHLLKAVQEFNPYDLYSKADGEPDVEALKPYYLELIDDFFPVKKIKW